ncbi:hypothetical protein [Evansella clarkii]|uniref:hypothetical protein n=1 Tax=Evansella clarkii TaxID=79879 RepID=UPI00099883A6|nr:hypothetical protein [Evansella clarkii]
MSDRAWWRLQAIIGAFIVIFGLSITWYMENNEEKGVAFFLNNTWLIYLIISIMIIMLFLIIFAGVRRYMGEVNRRTFLISFLILLGFSFFFSITRL